MGALRDRGRAYQRGFATGGVQRELGAIHVDRDAANVEGYALQDRGQRVALDGDLSGVLIDVESGANDDGTEIEGARDRGGHDREAERRAVVGSREVGMACGVERSTRSRADIDRSHFAGSGTARGGLLGFAFVVFGRFDLRLGAQRDTSELAGQALWQRHVKTLEDLRAVFAFKLEHERAVGPRGSFERSRDEPGMVGLLRWCARAPTGRVRGGGDHERVRRFPRQLHRGAPRPRRKDGIRGVGPARGRARQRRTGTTIKVQFEIFERQLWVFPERRAQLSRNGIQFDMTRELDDHSLPFHHDIDRQQAPERVIALTGDVDRSEQRAFQQRSRDFDRPHLRGVRAIRRAFSFEIDLGFGATLQPIRTRGIHHHTLRKRHHRVLEVSLSERRQILALRNMQIDMQPRGTIGGARFRMHFNRWAEIKRRAPRNSRGRRSGRCRFGEVGPHS